MRLSEGETIVDQEKFIETHEAMSEIKGKVSKPYKKRLIKFNKLKLSLRHDL